QRLAVQDLMPRAPEDSEVGRGDDVGRDEVLDQYSRVADGQSEIDGHRPAHRQRLCALLAPGTGHRHGSGASLVYLHRWRAPAVPAARITGASRTPTDLSAAADVGAVQLRPERINGSSSIHSGE